MNVSFKKFLSQVDDICDYIPFISLISNAVDLIAKAIIPKNTLDHPLKDHYYKHLSDKSVSRCLLFAIPIFGNIMGAALKNHWSDKHMPGTIGLDLQFASDELKNDKNFVIARVKEKGEAILFASPEMQKDQDVLLEAFKSSYNVKSFIPKEIFTHAFKDVARTSHPSYTMEEDFPVGKEKDQALIDLYVNHFTNIAYTAIQNDRRPNIPNKFYTDPDLALAIIARVPRIFRYFDNFKNDFEFIKKALNLSDTVFEYLPPSLRNNRELATLALNKNVYASNHLIDLSLDKEFLKPYILLNPAILTTLPVLSKDIEFIRSLININNVAQIYIACSREIKTEDFAKELIDRYSMTIAVAPEALKNDFAFVLKVITKDPRQLLYVHNQDILLKILSNDPEKIIYANQVLFIPDVSKSFITRLINEAPHLIPYLPLLKEQDKRNEYAIELLKINSNAFEYLPEDIQAKMPKQKLS